MRQKAKTKQKQWDFKETDSPVSLALVYIDGILDRIRLRKQKRFDETNINQLRKLTAAQLAELNKRLKVTFDGVKAAVENDPFCLECYSNYETDQLKIVLEYIKAIKTLKPDANANGKIRAVRQHKKRSPDVVVKKVLYLVSDPETQQTSIHPRELVGAKEMWTYNTKTRKLGCYYAKNEGGLSAKGTTILDYDTKRSTTKTIRKPTQQVQGFILAGKKYWDSIKAVAQEIPPRLSRETMILRISK